MNQPHDPQAERAILAACLATPKAITETRPLIQGDDFYDPNHELIWTAITTLADRGQPVDAITTAAALDEAGVLARIGGPITIANLLGEYVTAANVGYYARIVRDRATRRRMIAAGVRITQGATSMETPPQDLVTAAQAELTAAHRPAADDITLADQVTTAIDAIEGTETAGWSWPWADLRSVLIPPAPGQFIIFAARPGIGKSVGLVDIARHVALRHGLPAVLMSLEMSATEIIHRILAAEARVPLDHIKQNQLTRDEWDRVATATQALMQAPLTVLDDPSAGLAEARHAIQAHRPAVLLFDYVQLAKTNPATRDRRQALEEVSRGLKILAKQERVPIVVAAQVNRKAADRPDRTPVLSDLRETGSLEQDCDTAVLLHREDAEDPESPRAGEIDLIVAKQRNGPTGKVTLIHQLHYSRFVDAAGY